MRQTLTFILVAALSTAAREPGPPVPEPRLPEPEPAGAAALAWSERRVDGSAERDEDERTDFFFVDELPPGEVGFAVDAETGWLEYRVREERLILNVNARVAYEDMRLAADTVVYEAAGGEVEALGAPVLIEGDERVDGERMRYSFASGRGLVYDGVTGVEKGFATGERLKLQEGDVLHIANGTFTTSKRPEDPEYHFYCPRLKVYAGDKVVAKPIILFIGHVPVMAAPYYYYPLGGERRSGFLAPRLAYRSSNAFTLRNAYYWAINDYADATFGLDYDTERGWRQELEARYLYGTRWGLNYFQAVHDEDRSTGREWWSVSARHRQDLPWDIDGLLQIDARTDRYTDYLYAEDVDDRTQSSLRSFLSLSRSWDRFSLGLDLDHSASLVDYDAEEEAGSGLGPVTWTVPRVRAAVSQSELFETGAYLSGSLTYLNRLNSTSGPFRNIDLSLRLSRPFSLFRFFNFTPFAAGSLDWYRRAADGSFNHLQPLYNAGIGFNTRLYGLFYPGDDEVRHIVEPTASLSWKPEIDDELVPSGGQTQNGSTILGLGLTNRIKIHFGAGAGTEYEVDEAESGDETANPTAVETLELLRWDLNTSYALYGVEESDTNLGVPLPAADEQLEEPWSDLTSRVYLTPNFAEWYNARLTLSTSHDLYTGELNRFDLTAGLAFSGGGAKADLDDNEYLDPVDDIPGYDPLDTDLPESELEQRIDAGWRLGVNYDFTKGLYGSPDLQFLNLQAIFNLTDHWRLTYQNNLDLVTGDLVSQSFSIYRDLHSWEARLRLEESRGIIRVWFLVDIKDIPDIRIEGRPELY